MRPLNSHPFASIIAPAISEAYVVLSGLENFDPYSGG